MKLLSRKPGPCGTVLLFAVGILAVAGCGSKLGKLVPVSGKVTVNGKPVPSGQVMFAPEKNLGNSMIVGNIEDGTYKIQTDGKDGAPPGRYKVFLNTSMPGMKEKGVSLNPKYSDPNKSGLTKEVVENPPAGAYDLKLTK